MQIAPQTVVVTLLQHQIADELENFSVTPDWRPKR
jgi:hypothetical protein